MVFVSKEYKFVYIDIPRTASTSIKNIIQKKPYNAEMFGERHSIDEIPCWVDSSYFVWGVVRNPYDLNVSLFEKFKYHVEFGYKKNMEYSYKIKANNFGEFFRNRIKRSEIIKIKKTERKKHLAIERNQSWYFKKFKNYYIVKFENLQEEFNQLHFLESYINIPYCNIAARKEDNFIDYYSKETEEIVWQYYKEDFDNFGYERIDFSKNVVCIQNKE